jgi:hypothetical protein
MNLQPQLQSAYSRDAWTSLLRALFGSSAEIFTKPIHITDTVFKGVFTRVLHLGDLKTADGKTAALLDVEVAPDLSLARNRAGIRHIAARLIDGTTRQAILAAFHNSTSPDWRFSFIIREKSLDLATGETLAHETPARRFTYLLGPNESCRTAAERFSTLGEQASTGLCTLANLETAFSVEKLSDAFFAEYISHYETFARHATQFAGADDWQDDTEAARSARHFAKRLLARLVFLHFLQKKRWIGCSQDSAPRWNDGDTDFLRRTFQSCRTRERFHTAFLIPLFYETLNSRRAGDLFSPSGTSKSSAVRIPYLNGGLFEENPAEKPFRAFDFPSDLFDALFDFFSRFNFTIDESDPLDVEIGVDPEMLGRIFEALLEDNKEKGAYYTPKAIVAYMCQEALIRYLHTRLGADVDADARNAVASWVRSPDKSVPTGSPVKTHTCRIDRLLRDIKICDPAIGSGAFPMGMLQEIVRARLALDDRHRLDPASIKAHTIQNSVYGVDLDAGAVDIARLRFWLSLVVDEKEPSPLPNLDYKIMQGNSLLESFEGVDLSRFDPIDRRVPTLIENVDQMELFLNDKKDALKQQIIDFRVQTVEIIEQLLHDYFTSADPDAKHKIRSDIDAAVRNHINHCFEQKADEYRDKIAILEARLDLIRTTAKKHDVDLPVREKRQLDIARQSLDDLNSKRDSLVEMPDRPYFLWHLFFHDVLSKGGFDIVIGNPPFVRADNPSQEHQRKAILACGDFETLWEKWDLYVAFIEKGFKLLRPEGTLALITSDAYCHAKYGQKSREWFLRNARVDRLDFLGDLQVFEAAVHNVIFFYTNADGASNVPERRLHKGAFGNVTLLPSETQTKLTCRAFFPEDHISKAFACETTILESICYVTIGMVVNAHEKTSKGLFTMDDLVQDFQDKKHPKRFVEGKHLEMWLAATYRWLEWNTERAPSLFRRQTFPELYETTDKILVQRSPGPVPKCCYDNSCLHFNESVITFVPWHALTGVCNKSLKKAARYVGETPPRPDLPRREELEAISRRFSVKYLLGVMNSSVARDFLRANRRSNIHLYPDDWKNLPIPGIALAQQQPIVDLVNRILVAKTADPVADISTLESQIDHLVYKLYSSAPLKSP